jgi:Amt family ammonium transporter
MNPLAGPGDSLSLLCLFLILLTPLAGAGMALLFTGFSRSRNAAHAIFSALCILAVAAVVYYAVGFSLVSFPGRGGVSLYIHGKSWNLIGNDALFFHGLRFDGSPVNLAALLQMFAVGVAALIPLGAGCGRWRLHSILLSTALLAGLTYPIFAHWVLGGGWLAQLGENLGLGRGFLDTGGASTIHVLGGLTALSIAWILRPRHGRFLSDGMPTALPAHNVVYLLLGCVLALPGWIGLNAAGAILYHGATAPRVALIAVNTLLSAAAAALASAAFTRWRFGKPDASLSANGWIGGLVAASAGCAFVDPFTALLTGVVAGFLVPLMAVVLESRLEIDDPGGTISAHAVAGIWGLLAAGLFARFPVLTGAGTSALEGAHADGQFLAQLAGVATLLGFVLPFSYGLNFLLNRISPQRASKQQEHEGMDLGELGAGAYPEFLTRTNDFGGM